MPFAAFAGSAQDVVLAGPVLAALLFAAAAGLISFFSPCVLPLVPVYLAYVTGVAGDEAHNAKHGVTSRTMVGAALFVLGFAVVFTSYGALFGRLGEALAEHREALIQVSGVVTLVMGLIFLGLLGRIPGVSRTIRPGLRPQVGLAGAPVLGGLFAIGWTPCIGPTLAAVLTLATTSATAERGALLTFAYRLGLGIPFLIAGATAGRATRSFGWMRLHARAVTRTGGALLILIGVLQVTGAWSSSLAMLQGLVLGWQSPL